MSDAPRIVLDTNVCLDLLVFGDPRVEPLRAALQCGDVIGVRDDACRDEWIRVLAYPLLALDEVRRLRRSQQLDHPCGARAGRLDCREVHSASVSSKRSEGVPTCSINSTN